MVVINNTITKKELLDLLAGQANEQVDLYVNIESLPTFLTTPIAFTIFNYQISNYPRRIIWTSSDKRVLEVLKDTGVFTQPLEEAIKSISTKTEEKSGNKVFHSSYSGLDGFKNQDSFKEKNLNGDYLTPTYDFTQFDADNSVSSEELETEVFRPKISANELFKKEAYQPSLLLEAVEPIDQPLPALIDANHIEVQSQNQNFDSLIERIQSARTALNTIKPKNHKKPTFTIAKKHTMAMRVVKFVAGSMVLSGLLILFFLIFPTNVYSLDVVPEQKKGTSRLKLNQKDFLKNNKKLESKADISSSGQDKTKLNFAVGKATVVNGANRELQFDREGIILISDSGREYVHLPAEGEPGTFTVPGRNGSVTINIQARTPGDEANLGNGSRLKIVSSAKRQRLGSSFYGYVSKEINTTQFTGKKVVTQKDFDILKSKSEKQIGGLINEEIRKIKDNGKIVNEKWYQSSETTFSANQKVGDVSEKLTVKAASNVTLFYLENESLIEKLKQVNENIYKLEDINEVSYDGDFNSTESVIDIDITYTYRLKSNLNEAEIAEMLSSNNDFSSAKFDLQQQFPSIRDIKKEETGIKMPGVPARIDININEKE